MSGTEGTECKIDGIIRQCVEKWYQLAHSESTKPTIVDISKILKSNGLLPLLTPKGNKSNEKSGRLRDAGNRSYKAREFAEALRDYTEAICWAEEDDEPAALAYANRSAVHYEQQAYTDVVNDVGHALATGKYPDNMTNKLYERRAKSYLRLSMYRNAMEDCKTVVRSLTGTDVNEVMGQFNGNVDKEKLSTLLTKGILDKEKVTRLKSLIDIMLQCIGQRDRAQTRLKEPKLTHKPSKDAKTAYPAMDIAVSAEMGTHVVATVSISPGDILAVEKPAVSALTPEFHRTFCDNCKKRSHSSIPCHSCNTVVFCSVQCRNAAWVNHHSIECDLLPTVIDLGCKVNVLIAIRAFLKSTKCGKDLTKFIREHLNEANSDRNITNSKRRIPKTPQKAHILNREDYRSYHYFVTNEESRSGVQTIGTLTTALCLVHILKGATKIFEQPNLQSSSTHGPLPLEHIVTANLISRYFMAAGCNAFEIGESIPGAEYGDYEFKIIGGALYPTYCLLNHSCDPDVSVYMTDEETRVLYAIKPIRKGQQIFISYGAEYALHSRNQRQEQLKSKYFFACQCSACLEDWPLANDLPEYPKFVSLKSESTQGPLVYETCKRLHQIAVVADEGPITQDQLQTTIQFLCLYHKYVIRPWKYYLAAQRVIRGHFNFLHRKLTKGRFFKFPI